MEDQVATILSNIKNNLLPESSREDYSSQWGDFQSWLEKNGFSTAEKPTEDKIGYLFQGRNYAVFRNSS